MLEMDFESLQVYKEPIKCNFNTHSNNLLSVTFKIYIEGKLK